MSRLCFDYGYGGGDPGAIYKERCEKDDTLNFGRAGVETYTYLNQGVKAKELLRNIYEVKIL